MSNQKIENIKIKQLHLWSENPRDPIEVNATDYDIIKRAVEESEEWNLDKMAKEMGDHYDFSELPTVVYIEGNPVVFDGNRRVAVIKYLQDRELYSKLSGKIYFGDGPKELTELTEIPCNVCDKETALTNIERKHASNGSWGPLQREYFLHQHRGRPKSIFLMIEDQTNLISSRPSLNKVFVKDEIFTEKNLREIGFRVHDDEIISNYSDEESKTLLEQAATLIENQEVTTRKNRGSLKGALLNKFPENESIVNLLDDKKAINVLKHDFAGDTEINKRRTPVTKTPSTLFGKKLVLKKGSVNNMYWGVSDIYEKFAGQESVLPIVAMSLRLLLDTAARAYYIEKGDEKKASEDSAYKSFLKIAKSELLDKQKENSLSLSNEWLSDERNFDAILGKYAHGNIACKESDVIKDSKIVADILEHYFKKGKGA